MDDPGPEPIAGIILQFLAAGGNPAADVTATEMILKVLLLLVLIFVNAFFAMSEIAIISLNDNKVQKMAVVGDTTWEKWLTHLAKAVYATDARFFPSADISKAWTWLRE